MAKETKSVDVLIIGGGPAGLTAGIYAGRGQLETVIVERALPGGQIAQTDEVENYPGFPDGITGPELSDRMVKQAEKFGVSIVMDEATCATCDGFFYRGKEVVVVGGGDAAVEEGLFLTKFADKVTVIHRRDELRANKAAQERAFANPKMHWMWNTTVEEVLGDDGLVVGVKTKNTETGEEGTFNTDGVFIFIGHIPNTDYLNGVVELGETGYVAVKDEIYTNVEGIFAAGDVSDEIYRQLSTSVGAGTRAAMMAEKMLAEQEAEQEAVAA